MSTNTKPRGLGRGLDALLGGSAATFEAPVAGESGTVGQRPAVESARVHCLPLERIRRGSHQPRRDFDPDSLRELAESIAVQGVLQPIVVRAVGADYEIVAGERRWRAAQQAGLTEIPVVVREADEPTALALALIENIQRDNLNPLEEAGALQRLMEEFGLTHRQIAEAIGRSRAAVTNLLRLLELESEVKALLDGGALEMGHARALLGLKGAPQCAAARQAAEHGLSVRDTEKLVRRLQSAPDATPAPKQPVPLDPDIRRLQDDLTARLGAQVAIRHGTSGTGKLVIAYHSLDELDGILAHIH